MGCSDLSWSEEEVEESVDQSGAALSGGLVRPPRRRQRGEPGDLGERGEPGDLGRRGDSGLGGGGLTGLGSGLRGGAGLARAGRLVSEAGARKRRGSVEAAVAALDRR